MKIQRILVATIKNEFEEIQFQIVLAFTDREEFVTWGYEDNVKYYSGHYFQTFDGAHQDFIKRCSQYKVASPKVEYCAKQIGQAKIIWEEL